MANSTPWLTQARLRRITRWGLISSAGALTALLYVVSGGDQAMVKTALDLPNVDAAVEAIKGYPPFQHYRGSGRNIFAYRAVPSPHRPPVKKASPTPPPAPPPPPTPKPKIDIEGLRLTATVAAPDGSGWAIVRDSRAGRELSVAAGGSLRGATLVRVGPQSIVLRRGEIEAELRLKQFAPIRPPEAAESPRAEPEPTTRATGAKPRLRKRIGISVRELSRSAPALRGVPDKFGLLISQVSRSDIEVRVGDVLRAVDGAQVRTMSAAIQRLRAAQQHDSVTLTLLRDGKELTEIVQLVE